MKKTLIAALLAAAALCLGAAWAKDAAKDARKADAPAAAEEKKAPAPAPRKEAPKAEEQEEPGSVMIDSRADSEPGEEPEYRPRPQGEPDEANVPGGMPISYGLLKGAMSEGGRDFLVFENEEGTISFVQVMIGKNAVNWKLVARIRRSMD